MVTHESINFESKYKIIIYRIVLFVNLLKGFVLNKKVGGDKYNWNPRQTYTRVYDPRGFEFEIDINNLLYILENTSCIKGKGLEGEFVYGWDGKDLVLLPVGTIDYKECKARTEIIQEGKFLKQSELVD